MSGGSKYEYRWQDTHKYGSLLWDKASVSVEILFQVQETNYSARTPIYSAAHGVDWRVDQRRWNIPNSCRYVVNQGRSIILPKEPNRKQKTLWRAWPKVFISIHYKVFILLLHCKEWMILLWQPAQCVGYYYAEWVEVIVIATQVEVTVEISIQVCKYRQGHKVFSVTTQSRIRGNAVNYILDYKWK